MKEHHKHSKTGFTTPKNYFKSFEDNLYEHLQVPHETGYKTPEKYFDTIEDVIFKKTVDKSPKIVTLTKPRKWLYPISVAATIILCITLFLPNNNKLSFDDVEYASLEAYIESEPIDISPLEITELYNINAEELDSINFDNLNDTNLFEYLSSETTIDDFTDYEL